MKYPTGNWDMLWKVLLTAFVVGVLALAVYWSVVMQGGGCGNCPLTNPTVDGSPAPGSSISFRIPDRNSHVIVVDG